MKERNPNVTKRQFGRHIKGWGGVIGLTVGAGIGRYFLKDKEKNAQFKSRFGKFVGRQFEFIKDPTFTADPKNIKRSQKYIQRGMFGGVVGGSIGGAYAGHKVNIARGDAPSGS